MYTLMGIVASNQSFEQNSMFSDMVPSFWKSFLSYFGDLIGLLEVLPDHDFLRDG